MRRPAGNGARFGHVIARWRRRTMRERRPRGSLPLPPLFTFSPPLPASDRRHSWLPSHRLSSCFPSLRPRFVPLPRARYLPPLPPASPRPPSAAAFPARFANDGPIVSRSSAVVARVSRSSVRLALALARVRSVSRRCPAVAASSRSASVVETAAIRLSARENLRRKRSRCDRLLYFSGLRHRCAHGFPIGIPSGTSIAPRDRYFSPPVRYSREERRRRGGKRGEKGVSRGERVE